MYRNKPRPGQKAGCVVPLQVEAETQLGVDCSEPLLYLPYTPGGDGAISASGNSPRSLCLNCSQGHVSSGVIRIRPVTLLTTLVLLD